MSLKKELIGGLTTFLTMSYIIFVNPAILSTEGTGMSFSGVLTATVVLASSMTLLMGLYAKLPYAIAPGMGLNAFFTFTLVLGEKIPWPTALGLVFWSGVFFLVISLTPLREQIALALPKNIKIATASGIGFLLVFIGLKNAGIIVADPATFVTIGKINETVLYTILGLLIAIYFTLKKNPFAFLLTIFSLTALALLRGKVSMPTEFFSSPDFTSVFLKLDVWGALKWSLFPAILSLMLTDMFDSISSFLGVARAANLMDEKGEPKNLKKALVVDAIATMFSGLLGTSSGTTFIESASGIQAGGRTGVSSVFTALFFLPCLFIAPLVVSIPAFATAPVLILVGFMMGRSILEVKEDEMESWLPALATTIIITLSFSISKGLMWGIFLHIVLKVFTSKTKEISPLLWGLGLVSILYLFVI